MPNRIKLCENCGGRIELPHRWGRMVVCGPCHLQLSQPGQRDRKDGAATFWSSLLGAVVVLVAMGALAVAIVRNKSHRAGAIAQISSQSSTQPLTLVAQLPPFSSPAFVPPVIDEPTASAETQPTTAETSTTATIGGSVWIIRRGGESEPQSGVRVQLMRTVVSRAAYQSCLASESRTWQELAASYTTLAQALRDGQADPDADNDAADQAQAIANEARAGMLQVRAAIVTAPRELDTLTSLRFLADLAPLRLPDFDDAVADGTLLESVTDSHGRYQIQDVPPGYYYLHASVDSGSTLTEWCAPIHVAGDGETIRVDLSNSNAVVMRTTR